ncbi:solute carrier family 66 member 3 [Papilio machaon]|uniref:solute carrier family 66 member 3 n=1 Tax=Papilio machaon TaxID=76193 RepID=UPI001E6640C1|nr:solute carrier family 66 member 3 [Papilio machaon]
MEENYGKFIANILSTLTILSCLFLKVPQILSVRRAKSADCIYIQAMALEIAGFTVVTLYNFTNKYSLMTYMEYPIILMQMYILLYYVLKYKYLLGSCAVPISALVYFLTVLGFAVDFLPKDILYYLVPLCTPLSGFAKISYIYGMIKTGNADDISLITWIISLSTNLSRLFTVYIDSADMKLMCNFLISACLSGGVLATAVFYQKHCSIKIHCTKELKFKKYK